MRRIRFAAAMAAVTSLALADTVGQPFDKKADAVRWWAHIAYLADDAREGRATGSAGYQAAADYVAGQFKKLGLKPAGQKGYFQQVRFNTRVIDEQNSRLSLVENGEDHAVALGDDAVLSQRMENGTRLQAPLAFVGYGLSVPSQHYDDLAGMDLKGKVVVYFSGGPASVPGELRSHASTPAERAKAFKQAGIIGAIEIANPKASDIPWDRAKTMRLIPSMSLADDPGTQAETIRFQARWNSASAARLFAGSGHDFDELLAAAQKGEPLPQFALKPEVKAEIAVKSGTAASPNVAAILPGTDRALRNEYVVISAHLDHLGLSDDPTDHVYNGAMDDASGIATILEVARLVKASGTKPHRSIVFLAVCGEEKGLLGSRYFATHPTIKQGQIVADVNLDMFLPLHPLKYIVAFGADQSNLGPALKTVAEQAGIKIQPDPEPERNRFIRSDQYSFIRSGIPAIAFKFGYAPGSPEEALHKAWLKNRYHGVSDDLSQPIEREAAAEFNHIVADLMLLIANRPERPAWNPDSPFAKAQK